MGAAFFNCLASDWRNDWDNLKLIVPIEHYPELVPGPRVGHRTVTSESPSSSSSVDLIHVGTATDKRHDLEFDPNDTIKVLKCRLMMASGVPEEQQLLVMGGKQLEDDRTLSDYQIVPGSIIQLTVHGHVEENGKTG